MKNIAQFDYYCHLDQETSLVLQLYIVNNDNNHLPDIIIYRCGVFDTRFRSKLKILYYWYLLWYSISHIPHLLHTILLWPVYKYTHIHVHTVLLIIILNIELDPIDVSKSSNHLTSHKLWRRPTCFSPITFAHGQGLNSVFSRKFDHFLIQPWPKIASHNLGGAIRWY